MKKIYLFLLIIATFNACKTEEPSMANFEFTQTDEGKVTFKNTSVNANTYEWNFGNDLTSTEMNPNTQYLKNGDYSVVLTVKNKSSQDTKIQKVTISNATKAIAKFSWKSLGNGLVEFTNETQNADSFKWNFGNGKNSTEKSLKVQYDVNATYEVKLEATSFNGTTESKQNVTISDAPKPIADFNLVQESGGVLVFNNKSTNADTFEWTFGNGTSSTERNANGVYTSNGTYSVTLKAKNKNGENSISKSFSVSSIAVPTTGNLVFYTNFDGLVKIYIGGVYQGLLTRYVTGTTAPSCGQEGFVTVNLKQGQYAFTAEMTNSNNTISKWAANVNIVNGTCKAQLLTK